MALSFDARRTALLCLHFQNDIVDENGALRDFGSASMVAKQAALPRIAALQKAAREAGVKIIHVAVRFQQDYGDRPMNAPLWQALAEANALIDGTWGAEFHPSVAPAEGEVVVVNKGTSAFSGSTLRDELASSGVESLLLAGVATNFVVESTAREGADLGYEVAVLRDCCVSVSDEMHEAALSTALPFLATITDSDEVMAVVSSPVI
jgi:nicotinamidase-related amidase